MKKTAILSVLLILLFVMTACGTKSSNAAAANSISSANELAIGILNLEGTSQAIDSKSAAQLLPLWQLLDELSVNASAAPEEIAAVVGSIQAGMTAEQINAIDKMQLTDLNVVLAAQGSGSANSTVAISAGSTKSAQTSTGSAGQGTVLTSTLGGPPPGEITGGPGPSGNSQQNTSTSKSSSGTGTTSLIQQVIQLLQSKIQS